VVFAKDRHIVSIQSFGRCCCEPINKYPEYTPQSSAKEWDSLWKKKIVWCCWRSKEKENCWWTATAIFLLL